MFKCALGQGGIDVVCIIKVPCSINDPSEVPVNATSLRLDSGIAVPCTHTLVHSHIAMQRGLFPFCGNCYLLTMRHSKFIADGPVVPYMYVSNLGCVYKAARTPRVPTFPNTLLLASNSKRRQGQVYHDGMCRPLPTRPQFLEYQFMQGSVCSAIGNGINAIIAAIANLLMAIVGAFTMVHRNHCGSISSLNSQCFLGNCHNL